MARWPKFVLGSGLVDVRCFSHARTASMNSGGRVSSGFAPSRSVKSGRLVLKISSIAERSMLEKPLTEASRESRSGSQR